MGCAYQKCVGVEHGDLVGVEAGWQAEFFEHDRFFIPSDGNATAVVGSLVYDFHRHGSAVFDVPSEDCWVDACAEVVDVCDP